MVKLRKLLSAKWWIGPPPGPVRAMRRRAEVRGQRRLLAFLRRADRTFQSLGRAPRIECPICGHRGWFFYPHGAKQLAGSSSHSAPQSFSAPEGMPDGSSTAKGSPHSAFHSVSAPDSAGCTDLRVNPLQLVRLDAECPNCGSWERHRLTKMLLDELGMKSWKGPLLHFAPEPQLGTVFRGLSAVDYQTADLYDPSVDHRVDIQHLPFDDDSWSYIICLHVLEHVPDDERALAELRRVLRPGGILVLCVPCVPFYEESRLTVAHDPGSLARCLLGHYRTYGLDFIERVGRHFTVEDRSAGKRPVQEVLRHGLMMWSLLSDMLLVCRR